MIHWKKLLHKKEESANPIQPASHYKTIKEMNQAKLAAMEKKQKLLHYVWCGIVVLGILGGIKSLLPVSTNTEALAVNEIQTFVKTYATNYFTYPQTDDMTAYFKEFSLNPDWHIQYDSQKVAKATADNVEIYKVNPDEADSRYADYYLYLNQEITFKDGSQKSERFYVLVRLYNTKENGYLVTDPLSMKSLPVKSVEEDTKKELETELEKGSEQISEDEKQEVSNTISLFLDTYSTDYAKAQLLMENSASLDQLDAHTKLVLDNISYATKDTSIYYVETTVNEVLADFVTNKKNIHFKVDMEQNKIMEMEEY